MTTTIILDGISFADTDFLGYGYLESVTVGGTVYPRFQALFVAAMRDLTKALYSTSASSVVVGTGTKTFVLDTDVPFAVGAVVKASDSAAPSTNWVIGTVTSYTSATRTLVISVASGDTAGAGTLTSWVVTITGARGQTGAAGTNGTNGTNGADGSIADLEILTRSSDTILGVSDSGKTVHATGTFTQTFTAAATLGTGWWVIYKNKGVGVITLDFNSSETMDGGTTRALLPGESAIVSCNGTGFVDDGSNYGFFSGEIPSVTDAVDEYIHRDLPIAGEIISCRTKCDSGTATFTFKIGSTALGGTANSVSSSAQTQAHSSNNVFAIGDSLKITPSSNSAMVNATYSVLYKKR